MLSKVFLEEHPPATNLGAWDRACLGTLSQFFSIHPQKVRRLL
jgi:hypothetical protein